MENLIACNICPRNCGANRLSSLGFCGANNQIRAAKASLHFGEEPCISGKNGSGTIFFSGCNLRCAYCQNHNISLDRFGKEISVTRLAEIFLELQALGAHNINLVSPTPYVFHIIEAIDMVGDKIKIPFIYNTSGYEKVETLKILKGYIDIFLTDIKYFSSDLSKKYSDSKDYFNVALASAKQMIDQVGNPEIDSCGMLKSGVIIRHLVLPSHRNDSIKVLQQISKNLSPDSFLFSLMSQYTPFGNLANFPELKRVVTTFEYSSVVNEAINLGLSNGYMQDRSCATSKYTPLFDLSGL